MFRSFPISRKVPSTLLSVLKRGFRPVGIVGLPNVGKSTLFNALTKSELAEMANYPFCTINPNKADILFVFGICKYLSLLNMQLCLFLIKELIRWQEYAILRRLCMMRCSLSTLLD